MRKYFYRDGDQIKKYVYCTRGCQEAYKQNDIGNSILKVNNNTFICSKCAKVLRIQSDLSKMVIDQTQTVVFEPVPSITSSFVNETMPEMTDSKTQDISETELSSLETDVELKLYNSTFESTDKQDMSKTTLQSTVYNPEISELESELETEKGTPVESVLNTFTLQQQTKEENNNENDFFVFVLKCKDETFYVGATSNIEKAIKYHNQGCGSSHTRPKERRPVSLIEFQKTTTSEAKNVKDSLSKKYGIRGKDEMQTM